MLSGISSTPVVLSVSYPWFIQYSGGGTVSYPGFMFVFWLPDFTSDNIFVVDNINMYFV